MKMAYGAGVLNAYGRTLGSYVYMLMCAEGPEGILIKVGKANSPLSRVATYLAGCIGEPEILATAHVPNTKIAFQVETELHFVFQRWHVRGEWFRFAPADKADFNAAWASVFNAYSSPSWRVKWKQCELRPALAEMSRRAKQKADQRRCPFN